MSHSEGWAQAVSGVLTFSFRTVELILLQISHGIGLNILAFIPTVILGIIGGLLGAVFTFINLKV